MESRAVLLSTVFFAAISLVGCQTIKTDAILSTSDTSNQIKPVTWEKSGEVFHEPTNANLEDNESRVVFFSDTNNNPLININIGIGPNNLFQTSLQNGHYSDIVICSGSQIISVGKLNKEIGEVVFHSKNYQFIPQTTNYLQVGLSAAGSPVIQQIPTANALSLLNQNTRQTHQISRVLSDCTTPIKPIVPTPVLEPIKVPTLAEDIQEPYYVTSNILFDFDSDAIKSNNYGQLKGMANFIKSYPNMDITLEGHTDSKGSDEYNLKLSRARAKTVRDILITHYGLESMRIRAVGLGESRPVDTNETDQGRQNNRRVIAIVGRVNN